MHALKLGPFVSYVYGQLRKDRAVNKCTQIDYKILARNNPDFLCQDVEEWTAAGYRLIGGLTVLQTGPKDFSYFQAVGKPLE